MSSTVQPPQHMMYGTTLAEHQAEQWANAYPSSRGEKKLYTCGSWEPKDHSIFV